MRFSDFAAFLGISSSGGLMFFAFGVKLVPAIGIGFLSLVSGLSLLNYLNYGKFRPFVTRSSAAR